MKWIFHAWNLRRMLVMMMCPWKNVYYTVIQSLNHTIFRW
jgi:hypothetical protein